MPSPKNHRVDWKRTYGRLLMHICAWLSRQDADGKRHWASCQIASTRFNRRRLRNHPGKHLKLSVLSVYKHFRKYRAHGAAALAPRYFGPKRPSIPIPARYFLFRCPLSGKNNTLGAAARHVFGKSGGNVGIGDCYKLLTEGQKVRLKEIHTERSRIIRTERKLLAEFKAKLPRIPRQKSPTLKFAPGRAEVAEGTNPALNASRQSAIDPGANACWSGESGQEPKMNRETAIL